MGGTTDIVVCISLFLKPLFLCFWKLYFSGSKRVFPFWGGIPPTLPATNLSLPDCSMGGKQTKKLDNRRPKWIGSLEQAKTRMANEGNVKKIIAKKKKSWESYSNLVFNFSFCFGFRCGRELPGAVVLPFFFCPPTPTTAFLPTKRFSTNFPTCKKFMIWHWSNPELSTQQLKYTFPLLCSGETDRHGQCSFFHRNTTAQQCSYRFLLFYVLKSHVYLKHCTL